ncbi:hypothetical protein RUM43_009653 [Polyplax serrata]|uniref:Uncharacterized protein n=1 Tax=Polyplax serrata TaxID=468196 RepID=A0AAN8PUL6_POLSC
MDVLREREMKDSLERQLVDEQKTREQRNKMKKPISVVKGVLTGTPMKTAESVAWGRAINSKKERKERNLVKERQQRVVRQLRPSRVRERKRERVQQVSYECEREGKLKPGAL